MHTPNSSIRLGFVAGLLVVLSTASLSETIKLTTGRSVEGKIVAATADKVTLRSPGGVDFTLPKDRVIIPVAEWLQQAKTALDRKDYEKAADLARQLTIWDSNNTEARSILTQAEKPLQEAAEARKKAEAEARAQAEAQRKAQEEAAQKAKEEAEAKAKSKSDKSEKEVPEKPKPAVPTRTPARTPIRMAEPAPRTSSGLPPVSGRELMRLFPTGYCAVGQINVAALLKNPMLGQPMTLMAADPSAQMAFSVLQRIQKIMLAIYIFPEEHTFAGANGTRVAATPGLGVMLLAKGAFSANEAKDMIQMMVAGDPALAAVPWEGVIRKADVGSFVVARDTEMAMVLFSEALVQRAAKSLAGAPEPGADNIPPMLDPPPATDSPIWIGVDYTPPSNIKSGNFSITEPASQPKSKSGKKKGGKREKSAEGETAETAPPPPAEEPKAKAAKEQLSAVPMIYDLTQNARRTRGTIQLTSAYDLAIDLTNQYHSPADAEKAAMELLSKMVVAFPPLPGSNQPHPVMQRFVVAAKGDTMLIQGKMSLMEIVALIMQAMQPPPPPPGAPGAPGTPPPQPVSDEG